MGSFPEDWPEIAWAKLPLDIKQRAVRHLQAHLSVEDAKVFGEAYDGAGGHHDWIYDLGAGWHFSGGMSLRNLLREEVPDHQLPGLPEVYGNDYGGNWDDQYVQVLEAAIGRRAL
jgi:hypothetical protein